MNTVIDIVQQAVARSKAAAAAQKPQADQPDKKPTPPAPADEK